MNRALITFVVFLILVVLYHSLISPLVLSAVIAFLFNPITTYLTNRTRMSRNGAVHIAYAVFIFALVLFGMLVLPIAIEQATNIGDLSLQIEELATSLEASIESQLDLSIPLASTISEYMQEVEQYFSATQLFPLIQTAGTNLLWGLIVLVTSYYLMRDWPTIREAFFGLFDEPWKARIITLYMEIKAILKAYLRGQLTLMFLVGFLAWLFGTLVGLRGSLFIALLAAFLNIIPSIGATITALVAAMVAWQAGSVVLSIPNELFAALIVLIFTGIQLLEMLLLAPRIIGRNLKLHPGISLLAVIGTLLQFGAVYALLIIPIIGIGQALYSFTITYFSSEVNFSNWFHRP